VNSLPAKAFHLRPKRHLGRDPVLQWFHPAPRSLWLRSNPSSRAAR
jgi:hypothetical protein